MFAIRFLAGLALAVSALSAHAHSGSHTIVQIGTYWDGQARETIPIMRETVTVRYDTESADIGLQGQLVLVYQSSQGQLAILTPSGWKGFVSGLAEPIVDTQSLDPTYSLVFFDVTYELRGNYAQNVRPFGSEGSARNSFATRRRGTDDGYTSLPGTVVNARMPTYETGTLCMVLEQHGLSTEGTIYAAYGALQKEAEDRIEKFHAVKNPKITPEHIRSVYIELDGRQGEKYSPVITVSCDRNQN